MTFLRTLAIALVLVPSLHAHPEKTKQQKLIDAARARIGTTLYYEPSYQVIKYPLGDVKNDRGVCTDVIIRSFRKGLQLDLQKLIHLDMRANFSKYPKIWGLSRPDRNIDHRRVPNLKTYFTRRGWNIPVTKNKEDYQPGDLVISKVADRLPHIMIVSEKKSKDGTPLIIHNIGGGTTEEDGLFSHPINGHFRIK